jgi:hypothetical protein
MGYFHCRPTNPAENFILTSPTTIEELGEYRCNAKEAAWYFCKKCGVRVVTIRGSWEQVDLDVEKWAGTKKEGEEEKLQKVWMARGKTTEIEMQGKMVTRWFYLSVNAVTLTPSEDIDLRKWHDKGWVFYVENLKKDGSPMRVGDPHEGGMY